MFTHPIWENVSADAKDLVSSKFEFPIKSVFEIITYFYNLYRAPSQRQKRAFIN